MKRTGQGAKTPDVAVSGIASAAAVIAEFEAMLARRKKLDAAVEDAPAKIADAERELAELQTALASKEADVLLVDDAVLPILQKEIERLASEVDAKDLVVRRLRAQIDALESKAPEIDAFVDEAICRLRVEATLAAQNIQAEIAGEIRQHVSSLQRLYAKVRALQKQLAMPRTGDFLQSAYIPDLDLCMRVHNGVGYDDLAPNLLAEEDDLTLQAEAEVTDRMRPISSALVAARSYCPYVPLKKRPVPYVIRGIPVEGSAAVRSALAQQGGGPRVITEGGGRAGARA